MPHGSSMLALGVKHSALPGCRSGSDMLRQLYFSELDLVLHSRYRPQPGHTVFDSEEIKRVAERTTILKPLPEDRQALLPCCCCSGHHQHGPASTHPPCLSGIRYHTWATMTHVQCRASVIVASDNRGPDDMQQPMS